MVELALEFVQARELAGDPEEGHVLCGWTEMWDLT